MPAPSTAAELLELVRKSGLVDDARLAGTIQSPPRLFALSRRLSTVTESLTGCSGVSENGRS